MKTLVVLTPHPEFVESVRAGLNPEQYRVAHPLDFNEAEPLLSSRLADICLVDAEGDHLQAVWLIEKLRTRFPALPLLVFTSTAPWEWEEEAYIKGVAHVLTKPVRGRLLATLLERLQERPAPCDPPPPAPVRTAPFEAALDAKRLQSNPHALQSLRDFSGILTHSYQAEGMLRECLLRLREIVAVNRVAVFLRRPATFGGVLSSEASRQLGSACAIGLPSGLLEHFELSFDTGIGGHLFRQGRILRRESPESAADPQVRKEFELLRAEVAIPIFDRETLIGVATLDGRVTGEPLTNPELELIFHLLEELGLAVRNIWLHDQLAANHELMAKILRELSSACVVVSHDLVILHANRTARQYFAKSGRRDQELEFTDLPQAVGAKVFQVLKTGAALAPFRYQPKPSSPTAYQVTIVPFLRQEGAQPNSALLVVEDHTQAEQFKRLEQEASSLRQVRSIAERLAHEINNAVVPLDTCQQMLDQGANDPEFVSCLGRMLADGVKRISRCGVHMRILAQDTLPPKETLALGPLVQEAFDEACRHQATPSILLQVDTLQKPCLIAGSRRELKIALEEVFINAIQANPKDSAVHVSLDTEFRSGDTSWVHVRIQDKGDGFNPGSLQNATKPFFGTKTVGLGLGLTVCQRIIEMHQGKLFLDNTANGITSTIRISLPLDAAPAPGQETAKASAN